MKTGVPLKMSVRYTIRRNNDGAYLANAVTGAFTPPPPYNLGSAQLFEDLDVADFWLGTVEEDFPIFKGEAAVYELTPIEASVPC